MSNNLEFILLTFVSYYIIYIQSICLNYLNLVLLICYKALVFFITGIAESTTNGAQVSSTYKTERHHMRGNNLEHGVRQQYGSNQWKLRVMKEMCTRELSNSAIYLLSSFNKCLLQCYLSD